MTDDPPALIFRWKPAPLDWRLWFFVLASFLAHAVAFYVLRVVHPPAARVSPEITRVTLLRPSDPRAAPLLRMLDDRAALISPGDDSEMLGLGVGVGGFGVAFQPSFQGHEIALRELPGVKTRASLPTLLAAGEIVLPGSRKIPDSPPAAADADIARPPRLHPGPGLSERAFELLPDLLGKDPAPGRHFRVFAAVRQDGVIQNLIADEETDTPLPAGIAARLRGAVRFEPSVEPGISWGWIDVDW